MILNLAMILVALEGAWGTWQAPKVTGLSRLETESGMNVGRREKGRPSLGSVIQRILAGNLVGTAITIPRRVWVSWLLVSPTLGDRRPEICPCYTTDTGQLHPPWERQRERVK